MQEPGGGTRLAEALADFVQRCNNNERLVQMNREWNRTVEIAPWDAEVRFWVRSRDGRLSWGEGASDPDLRVEAALEVLEAVFSGRMAPTEPYDQGDLLVKGQQDDLLRLDLMTLVIWGE